MNLGKRQQVVQDIETEDQPLVSGQTVDCICPV
jgi:hypothetical protein